MTAPESQADSRSARDGALAVVRRLREAGQVAYFAGGCVRDALLGLEPKDYDIATDAPPQRVRELFRNSQSVGAAFGVILVRHHGSQVEVATFRSDGAYADGRRPTEVRFTTAEEDAKRRDFTINGLFFDPVNERVIDYVGGQEDLRNKMLRAIGDADRRFEEDHLRLLRAIRFAARFGLTIEPATSAAIRSHAKRLARISPERIADELRLMFAGDHGEWAWSALRKAYPGLGESLFRFAGPAPDWGDGSAGDPNLFRGRESGRTWSFGLQLAAASLEWAMHQEPSAEVESLVQPERVKRMVRALRQSLRISNDEAEEMEGSLTGLGMILREKPPCVATVKRFLARPTASLTREMLAQLGSLIGQSNAVALEATLADISKTEYAPAPLVTGDDLTAAGLSPGPVFKRVLDAVYDEQLEGRVATKEQAVALAIRLATMG